MVAQIVLKPPMYASANVCSLLDHGKTTLVDAMLQQSSVFRDNEQVRSISAGFVKSCLAEVADCAKGVWFIVCVTQLVYPTYVCTAT